MHLFLCIQLAIVLILIEVWISRGDDRFNVFEAVVELLGLTVCNVMTTFVLAFIICGFCPTQEESYSFRIHALQDNIVTKGEISGGHFSTRGYIDGEMRYFFMRTMGYGDKMGWIPANKTYIRYNDDAYPHIEVYKNVCNPPEFIDWLVGDIFDTMKPEAHRYVMVVPEGSVIDGVYEIDMQ